MNRNSQIIMSLASDQIETENGENKENGLFSSALNRRTSERAQEEGRKPFGELVIEDLTKESKKGP